MRIGIFGGSFNPPHNGHLHLAEQLHAALQLDEVWLVPARIPPHKSSTHYAPDADRLAMCRLIAEDYSWMRVRDDELRRDTVSYSYYTVKQFTEERPEDQFFFLVGGDMLRTFTQWHRWQEILQLTALAGAAREEDEYGLLVEAADHLRQYGEIHLVNVESYPLSSTKLRDMIGKKQDCSCYLPEKIVQYITMTNLYAGSDEHVSDQG